MMETSVKAAEVLAAPQPDVGAPPRLSDPMEDFSRRLEDIISQQKSVEKSADMEKMEAKDDVTVAMETEAAAILQRVSRLPSAELQLEAAGRSFTDLLSVLQRRISVLLEEKQSSLNTRNKLENLCRELQQHYSTLREDTVQRCRQEEQQREEMSSHFQSLLSEIQEQIELHSKRNHKLCSENVSLTEKLEGLMAQCERREESLEKLGERRDLQHKLTEAKLQQTNALLQETTEKHKREKEYLLREAIEKTKKCFAMKEQELAMKKKLTLYAQKFDEFQETLAKSNEIYARFKKEMDNMSARMKKMDKESNLWKTRFENCNKALTDMIEERAEKNKEYEVFVLKIQKLEKLCRALQEERVVLYEKIKEVRQSGTTPAQLSPADLQELQQLQEADPQLTSDMSRLREEQEKLQKFANSLLLTASQEEEEEEEKEEEKEEEEEEEDVVAAAFSQFRTRTEVKKEAGLEEESVPEQAVEGKVLPGVEKEEEQPVEVEICPQTDGKPQEVKVQPHEEVQPEPQPAQENQREPEPQENQNQRKPEPQENQRKPEPQENQNQKKPEPQENQNQRKPEPQENQRKPEPQENQNQKEPEPQNKREPEPQENQNQRKPEPQENQNQRKPEPQENQNQKKPEPQENQRKPEPQENQNQKEPEPEAPLEAGEVKPVDHQKVHEPVKEPAEAPAPPSKQTSKKKKKRSGKNAS